MWHGGNNNEDELLANCYRNSFRLAKEHNLSISTGAYGFPFERATRIALIEIFQGMGMKPALDIKKVHYVCFSDRDFQIYRQKTHIKKETSWNKRR